MPSGIPATAKVTATRIMYILGLLLFFGDRGAEGFRVRAQSAYLGLRVADLCSWGFRLGLRVVNLARCSAEDTGKARGHCSTL